jgi:hypothetical protein
MKIESGTGNGRWAAVDKTNRVLTRAIAEPIQHSAARDGDDAYQVIGTHAWTTTGGTFVPLYLQNNSTERSLVITRIRTQIVFTGTPTLPVTTSYINTLVNSEYSTGGSVVTPINLSVGSGNQAETISYTGNPTLVAGSDTIDTFYPASNGELVTYDKGGALLLRPGRGMAFSLTTAVTAGTVYVRVSFFMED